MATEVKIVLDAVNEASGVIKQVDTDLKKLGTTAGESGTNLRKFGSTFNKDLIAGFQKGTATTKDFGDQLLKAGDSAGLSSTQISKMAGATGFFTDQQQLAGRSMALVAGKAEELAAAVARGDITTRQAGKAFSEYAKAQEVAAKQSQTMMDRVKGMIPMFTAVAAGLVGVGIAAKKAFDWGKEGATIAQTQESFDRLLASLTGARGIVVVPGLRTSQQSK